MKLKICFVLAAVGAGVVFWLWNGNGPAPLAAFTGQPQDKVKSARTAGDGAWANESEINKRRSPRHAGGEIEKQRRMMSEHLDQRIREHEAKLEERRKEIIKIAIDYSIIYRGSDHPYSKSKEEIDEEDNRDRRKLEQYNSAEREEMQLESEITTLLRYDGDLLMIYAAGLDLPDNTVKQLYPKYKEIKREMDRVKKGVISDRQAEAALTEQMQAIKQQISDGMENLRAALQVKLDLTKDTLNAISDPAAPKKEEGVQLYVIAKQAFETENLLLHELRLRKIAEMAKAANGGQ